MTWPANESAFSMAAHLLPARILPLLRPKHQIHVWFHDCARISYPARSEYDAKAVFSEPAPGDSCVVIHVAMKGHSYAKSIEYLAHELAHYDEWRRTGKTSEKGIGKRTARILADLDPDTLWP